jgi:tRNA(fMet)-specific endonuclease VapC
MYLLDTNTLIYFFKGMGNVADNLLSKSPKEIFIPSIVLFELEVGIAKSNSPAKRRKQLEALSSRVQIVSFDQEEAKAAANIRANLEKQGTPIGPYDTFIAGIALQQKLTLITHNIKEFSRIKKLVLEDWF